MKTLKELEQEIDKACQSKYRSDDAHCDTWMASKLIASENNKFAAYVLKRLYESYYGTHDDEYNQICVHGLETSGKRETSMVKVADERLFEAELIDEILSVSNEGTVTYKTRDGKIHSF
jgi:hypothetical protein